MNLLRRRAGVPKTRTFCNIDFEWRSPPLLVGLFVWRVESINAPTHPPVDGDDNGTIANKQSCLCELWSLTVQMYRPWLLLLMYKIFLQIASWIDFFCSCPPLPHSPATPEVDQCFMFTCACLMLKRDNFVRVWKITRCLWKLNCGGCLAVNRLSLEYCTVVFWSIIF